LIFPADAGFILEVAITPPPKPFDGDTVTDGGLELK
jgi:hypothetical protein